MGKLRALAAVAVLSASASGCWLQSGFTASKAGNNSGESTVTTGNVADLEVAWTADVGNGAQEALIRAGTAYVRSDGAVTALDVATGEVVWSVSEIVSPDGTPVPLDGTGVPAVVEGTLQVPVDFEICVVVSLDLGTGELLGGRTFGPTSAVPPGSACTMGDVLEVNGAAMVPYNWFAVYGIPPDPPRCPPDNVAWWSLRGIGVVDVSGTTGWDGVHIDEGDCGTGPAAPLPQFGPPSVVGDHVLVPHDGLSAYPLAGCPGGTTCPSWTTTGPAIGPAVGLANGDIAVGGTNGVAMVVDGTTHTVEWGVEDVGFELTAPLAATDTNLYAAFSNDLVGVFPLAGCGQPQCTAAGGFTVPGGASARPSIGGDVLYVGSADGTVTAVPAACDPTPCQKLFTHNTGSRITGAPAIYAGTLIVGSGDGTVTAFRLPG